MYSSFPKKDQIRIRTALAAAWFFTTISGIGSIYFTSEVVQGEMGTILPIISGIFVLIGGILGFTGVVTNRHWLEWASAWLSATGMFSYAATVSLLFATGDFSRLQGAGALSALICFMIYRAVACAAHAKKKRDLHSIIEEQLKDV